MLLFHGLCLPLRAAQESEQPDADLNAPGPEHKLLNQLSGDWDVTLKIPIGPGKFVEGKSRCHADWVMEGRFLRQEYNSTFQGKPLTVVRYIGYDRHKGKVVEIHFESTHTDVMHSEGILSEDRKTITARGRHVDVSVGQEVDVQTVTKLSDDGTFTLEMTYAPDGSNSRTVTLVHNRR